MFRFGIFFVAAFTASACSKQNVAPSTGVPSDATMSKTPLEKPHPTHVDNAAVFDTVDRLVASLPLDPARVGELLGVKLERHPAKDTPVLIVYGLDKSAARGLYESVELRLPNPTFGNADDKGLLVVGFRAGDGIDEKAITDRFGSDYTKEVQPPREFAKGTAAMDDRHVYFYLIYHRPWGKLSFGMAQKDSTLLSFVIDSTEPKSATKVDW